MPTVSLREQIVRKARAKGIAIQSGPGVTSGTGRIIRHTGVFVNETDTSARTKQKHITQGVAAQVCDCLMGQHCIVCLIRNRTSLRRAHHSFCLFSTPAPQTSSPPTYLSTCPSHPTTGFSSSVPDVKMNRHLCFSGEVCLLLPKLCSYSDLLVVITMYTNSGAKGANHDYTPQISSVGAPSYVGAQVYVPAYGSVFQSIACARLHAAMFMRVPRTHLIMSLARDRAAITTDDVTKGSRPLTLCTLGDWSNSTTRHLVSRADAYDAQAEEAGAREEGARRFCVVDTLVWARPRFFLILLCYMPSSCSYNFPIPFLQLMCHSLLKYCIVSIYVHGTVVSRTPFQHVHRSTLIW